MRRILFLLVALGLVGCTSGTDFFPQSKAVLNTHQAFLDDIAAAETAERIMKICPGYEFNQTEGDKILDRFAKSVERLAFTGRAPIDEVIAYQENAVKLAQSKSSRAYIVERAAKNLADLGITPEEPDLICRVGEEQFQKQTEIGKFLLRKKVTG